MTKVANKPDSAGIQDTFINAEVGRILVVDDLSTNRLKISMAVKKLGHMVSTANDGAPALNILRNEKIDLVLLDIDMPEMNGYEVLEIMKSSPDMRDLPVIVISAVDEMPNIIKAIKLGAQDFLPKSFDPVLLATRIGACLEQKRLRDSTSALLNRLENELEDARQAQLNMVPSIFPQVSNTYPVEVYAYTQPALEVGGDFYDFFYLGTDTFWFVVGDVSDKGVAAGMFMARTSALIRLIPAQIFKRTGEHLSPQEVLMTLNEELCKFNPEMTFVTVILGRLNHKSGELLLVNAGHANPCLLSASAECTRLETARGRPLGIREDSQYEDSPHVLNAGQTLFIYTDGISDAINDLRDKYSDSRLIRVLQSVDEICPSSVVNVVNESLSRFTERAPQFDDITMMGIRR